MGVRKIYIVPNLVTTANLFCGFASIIQSIHGEFITAAWLLIAAGVFDMLDGRIARMAKATSAFGVEYDSMADLISFGLAPAILMYQWALEPMGRLGMLGAFLYVTCAALRLARFNVNTTTVSKAFFQGVASPIAAGCITTLVIFQNATGFPTDETFIKRNILALVLTVVIGTLMVTSIPFPSFKELNWRSRSSFGYLMIAVMIMILIAVAPEVTLFLLSISYIVLSLAWNAIHILRGDPVDIKKSSTPAPTTEK